MQYLAGLIIAILAVHYLYQVSPPAGIMVFIILGIYAIKDAVR